MCYKIRCYKIRYLTECERSGEAMYGRMKRVRRGNEEMAMGGVTVLF